jgi:hypothetical protein
MFSQNGFCDDGPHSAGSGELHHGGNDMNGKDNQIVHA